MLVVKLDHAGQEKVRYKAVRIPTTETNCSAVRAEWQTPTITTETTTFATGDYLHEYFYTDRWYNVFALYSGETGALKGWYCNITRPTQCTSAEIRWTDLELDVWVDMDGDVVLLDEEAFEAIDLTTEEHAHCLQAVETIKDLSASGALPR